MRHRAVLAAALAAGALGVVASLALGPRSRLADMVQATTATAPAGVAVAGLGDAVPALALPDPQGRPRRLRDLFGGRPALVNFWASWCRPCLEEMPALDAFARRQGARGVQVVGIALDDADAVRAFLRARPVGYPVLVETPGPADAGVRLGNVRGVLPYSVLVAADGRLLRRWSGPLTSADLEGATRTLRTRD